MEYIAKFPKHTKMKYHIIKLEKGKQLLFGLIYILGLVKLETLNTYIETNLANSFIWRLKSSVRALILFYKKSDKNLRFCMDYWGFNNFIIKNQYPPSLINELLHHLSWTK